MAKFIITRTYKHTESLEVEANSEEGASIIAWLEGAEFVPNNDLTLYDQVIEEVKEWKLVN